jgi:nucleotide-binding universal stress UspA family protein
MSIQIMVPLDGSHFSEQALPTAVDLATRWHAGLHLVRVDEDLGNRAAREVSRLVQESYLTELAMQLRIETGLSVRVGMLQGEIASALESYSRFSDIDLVVMTTHGRSGISRIWVGSVADELVRHSSVPVLMLRPQRRPAVRTPLNVNHILVALDGTRESERILDPALKIARLLNARLSLVRVYQPELPTTYAAIVESQIDHGVDRILDADAHDYVERIAHRVGEPGLRLDTIVLGDSTAADGIVHAAARCKADLIAMTTHGRTGWPRIAFGSVESDVAAATHVPMLVQRIVPKPTMIVGA